MRKYKWINRGNFIFKGNKFNETIKKNNSFFMKSFLILLSCFIFSECLSGSDDVMKLKPDSNTVALFPFDRNSQLNDISSKYNHGKILGKGNAIFKEGKFGQCIDASQGTVFLPLNGLKKSLSGTVEMLVNFTSFDKKQVLWTAYGPKSNVMILENRSKKIFLFSYYDRKNKKWYRAWLKVPVADALKLNKWYQLTLVWNNQDNRTTVALLVNKKVVDYIENWPKLHLNNPQLFVGGLQSGANRAQCLIDEFRFSDIARHSIAMTKLPLSKRKRIADRTYFFGRSQTQYNLYRNYLNNHHIYKWNDRPLFYNRDFWHGEDKKYEAFKDSILRDIEIIKSYGLDGLASLVHDGEFCQISRNLVYDVYDQIPPQDIKPLLEVTGGSLKECRTRKEKSSLIKFIGRALKCPSAFRINGKVMVTSYVADLASPEQLRDGLDYAHKIYGDKFVFIADIRIPKAVHLKNWPAFEIAFDKNHGKMPVVEIEAFKSYLRSYLDVCDGIMFVGSNHLALNHFFNEKFYREFLIPCFTSVLAEPKYQNKYLGLSASVGYVNPFSGIVKLHDGTRQLRQSLQAAIDANPDFIVMPEWNEVNENTSLQPTILSSKSSQRILKYYTSKNKGLKLKPNPGDNPLMPDLIISTPAAVKLGDRLFIELLNIPDSNIKEIYKVDVSLVDEKGKVVKQFPTQSLDASIMQEKRLYFPTEKLGDSLAVYPRVKIKTSSHNFSFNEGLYPVRVRPTWNWNYCSVRQPLQDIAHMTECKFNISQKSGKVFFTGSIKCDEPIATAELLEDETEMFAVDPKREYKLNKNEALIGINWNSRPDINTAKAEVTIEVENGEIRYMENRHRGIGAFFEEPLIRTGKSSARLPYYRQNCKRRRGGYFIITNKNKAILKVTVKAIGQTFSIPVKQIEEAGVYTKQFPIKGVMLRFEVANRLIDTPMLNKPEANFETNIVPLNKNSVFHLRIVTKSGKIYRSHPLTITSSSAKSYTKLPVFSESEKKVIPVKVNSKSIPEINYIFTPRHGNALTNSYGYNWNAELAGGSAYGGPANRSRLRLNLPGPTWEKKDGIFCLKFNGKNNYLWFPHAVIPLRSGFTVTFEVYPESEKNQVLLNALKGPRLTLIKGELVLNCSTEGRKYPQMKTGLKLLLKQWSCITLIYYPGKGFYVKVNGKSSSLLPFKGRFHGLYKQVVFGCVGRSLFFEGLLRSFRVVHKPIL